MTRTRAREDFPKSPLQHRSALQKTRFRFVNLVSCQIHRPLPIGATSQYPKGKPDAGIPTPSRHSQGSFLRMKNHWIEWIPPRLGLWVKVPRPTLGIQGLLCVSSRAGKGTQRHSPRTIPIPAPPQALKSRKGRDMLALQARQMHICGSVLSTGSCLVRS